MGIKKFFKRFDKKILVPIYKYHEKKPHTVLAKIIKEIFDNGVTIGINTNNSFDQNVFIDVGDNNILAIPLNVQTTTCENNNINNNNINNNNNDNEKQLNNQEATKIVHDKFEIVNSPQIPDLRFNKLGIIHDCIEILRIVPGVKTFIHHWNAINIYGTMIARIDCERAKIFFHDAETAVYNYIESNKHNYISESDLFAKIDLEYEFAIERTISSL